MNPMGSPGVPVDIVSGLPLDDSAVAAEKSRKEERRIHRLISDFQELSNDLKGEGGVTLEKVALLYAERISVVTRSDPQCQAFQSIFDDLKIKINVGKRLAELKVKEVEEAIDEA